MTVTAHTGNCNTEENSIASLESAVKIGADIVEFDLRFDKNSIPIMTHNKANGNECVTVEKAFEYLANQSISINVDVKETTDLKAVASLAEKYKLKSRMFFTGIDLRFVKDIKNQCPGETYYLNYIINPTLSKFTFYAKYLVNKVKKANAVGLNCNYIGLTDTIVKEFHKNKLLVSAWTANTPDIMEKLLKLNVDNITSRHPDVLIELIK